MTEDLNAPELEFPMVFPLRIIGEEADDFESFVLEIVRRHVSDLLEENIMSRMSSQNKYRSISIEFLAQTRAQVDALCAELGTHARIKMLL
jgi:putative lipoic acid-binding regulatory protein